MKAGPSTGWQLIFDLTGTKLRFEVFSNGSSTIFDGNATVGNSAWHYVTMVVNRSGPLGSLYVDGTLDVSNNSANIALDNTNTGPLHLGVEYTFANFYKGSIAIVQVYNRVLSAGEIKKNCLAQEGRFTSTPQSICGAP